MAKKENYLKNKIINLVSISAKDRTIFTKLNSNDIFNPFIFYDAENINKLFDYNYAAELSHKNDWNTFELNLIKAKNSKEFLNYLDDKSIFIPKSKINLLNSNFAQNKQNILDYLKEKFELLDKKLFNLDAVAITREADTGDWCLFLGRYFLTGSMSNGEVIKAPLFFKEVEISLKDASLKSKGNDLKINEKLIVHLIKQERKNALLLKEWNEIIDIKTAIDFLNSNFSFDLEMPNHQTDFINEDMPIVKERTLGKLLLEDSYIFGFFRPNGGKLKQDLEHIIDIKADVFGDDNKVEILNPEELILNENSKWLQISGLNLSQLFALNLSLKSNTIIHGPPGTGKSETIANIIANIIMNNKTALMVSEKKAALDVLMDRLGPLKDFGIFFQDTKITKDKVIFYKTIKKLGDIFNENIKDSYDFSYSENVFNSLIKEKHDLNRAYVIMNQIKQWVVDGFDYNDYLEAKYQILNEAILRIVKKYHLFELSRGEFFSVNSLAIFLVKMNLLDDEEKTDLLMLKMKNSFIEFENKMDELNIFWNKLTKTKFDLKSLSILEVKKIEDSQQYIARLFDETPNLLKMFNKNIFVYENLENYYFELEKYCEELNVDNKILIRMMQNDNARKILDALKHAGIMDKKYVISNWYFKDEIKTEKFTKLKLNNWKSIILVLNKITKYFDNFNDFFIYLTNREILKPLNIFFFQNKFIFEKHLTDFIENHWLNINPIISKDVYENKITFEKAQLAKKVFNFEDIYLTEENKAIVENYISINDSIYLDKNIDWNIVINEIYQKLIISWRNKIKNSEHLKDVIEVFRLSNLKRFPKIKTFMKKYFDSLIILFPIWISRPEDVSDIIECNPKIFNYGIFDEASQMFLERAYPILYRTDIKIVAGDDKQLKPSSFFNTRYHEEDEEDEEDENIEAKKIKYSDLDSLLLRAIVSDWNEILLNNHYRSVSQDLIEFSNKHIYDSKLNVATFNQYFDSKAFEVIDVDGYFVERVNRQEASIVFDLIVENLNKYKKILIITFNESQALLITSKILSSKNKEVITKIREAQLIVTNLENVQGNEGDLVILSVAYGRPSSDRRMRNSFGPLNMDGGKNRLNVAVTRAKQKMIVVKSFRAKDMIVSPTNLNAQCFRDFIAHCDKISDDKHKEVQTLGLETSFEKDVSTTLTNYILERDGFYLYPKYKIGTKRIDIAIYDSVSKKIVLGLELHQWTKPSVNLLEDFDKQAFIKTREYAIYNIFEINWRMNKDKIKDEIVAYVKNKTTI